MDYTLNIKGQLMSLAEPRVMGILNVTPDSFYAWSRVQTEREVAERANRIVGEGGAIVDVGACSTRPGSTPVDEPTEMDRLRMALDVVRRELPYAVVSVDTFRPDVARMAVEEFGVDIVNGTAPFAAADGEGSAAEAMLRMVAHLRVPYIIMSTEPTLRQTLLFFADRVQRLRELGHKDIILDPGFGFGKTLGQNYAHLNEMEKLLVMQLPLLVGVSRKSMIYRLLDIDAGEALGGTMALNMVALMKGASLLRVHDVKEAVDCVRLAAALRSGSESAD